MLALRELVNKPGARAEFDFAQANPDSAEAKTLYRKIKPLLRQSGGKVPFSAMERSQGVAKMYKYFCHTFICIKPFMTTFLCSYLFLIILFKLEFVLFQVFTRASVRGTEHVFYFFYGTLTVLVKNI